MLRKKLFASLAVLIMAFVAICGYHKASPAGAFFTAAGSILRDTGFLRASTAAYSAALYFVPKAAKLYTARGYNYALALKFDAALADYNQAIAIGGPNADRLSGRAYAEAMLNKLAAKDDDPFYDKAARRDLERVIADSSAAITLKAKSAWNFEFRAGAYAKLRQYDLATSDLTRAIAISGPNAGYLQQRGHYYTLDGKYDQAIADFSAALALDRADLMILERRGYAYAKIGQHELSIADYSKAIEVGGKTIARLDGRASGYSAVRRYSEAVADYSAALELSPSDSHLYSCRGSVFLSSGLEKTGNNSDIQQAIADFSHAIIIKPDNGHALAQRARAYAHIGMHSEAVADYTVVFVSHEFFIEGYRERGASYLAMKEYQLAAADYTEYLRLRPKNERAGLQLSIAVAGLLNAKKAGGTDRAVKALSDLEHAANAKCGSIEVRPYCAPQLFEAIERLRSKLTE